MGFMRALIDFALGILKRAYFWVPLIFLDLFDLYARYLYPRLPSWAPEDIVISSGWALLIFLLLLAWSAFMTYYELWGKYRQATSAIDISPFAHLVKAADNLRIIWANDSTPDVDGVCQEAVRWTKLALNTVKTRLGGTAYAQVCTQAELPLDKDVVDKDFEVEFARSRFSNDEHRLALIRDRHYKVLYWLKGFIEKQSPIPDRAEQRR